MTSWTRGSFTRRCLWFHHHFVGVFCWVIEFIWKRKSVEMLLQNTCPQKMATGSKRTSQEDIVSFCTSQASTFLYNQKRYTVFVQSHRAVACHSPAMVTKMKDKCVGCWWSWFELKGTSNFRVFRASKKKGYQLTQKVAGQLLVSCWLAGG